jgi:hypothetical protein
MGSEQAPRAKGGARSISRMVSHGRERPERGYPREALHKIFDEGCLGSE